MEATMETIRDLLIARGENPEMFARVNTWKRVWSPEDCGGLDRIEISDVKRFGQYVAVLHHWMVDKSPETPDRPFVVKGFALVIFKDGEPTQWWGKDYVYYSDHGWGGRCQRLNSGWSKLNTIKRLEPAGKEVAVTLVCKDDGTNDYMTLRAEPIRCTSLWVVKRSGTKPEILEAVDNLCKDEVVPTTRRLREKYGTEVEITVAPIGAG
jgi:hypothetical protein